jgi:hypothetical protein
MESIKSSDVQNFTTDHVITLYDYDKETIIFQLEIDCQNCQDDIANVDFSSDLLDIGSECEKFPLNKSFYKIIKINEYSYILDFN